jgi:adenosylhomocysteine nucleosidase
MKILVTFAIENEFAPWRGMRKFRRTNWGAIEVFVADVEGAEIGVALTGVGPRLAGSCSAKIFRSEHDSIKCCITSGFAGALRPEYQIGDMVVARRVYSESARSRGDANALASSDPLVSFATDSGAKIADRFYSAERVVARAEEKAHLANLADAVEMESFEIMREAASDGVPSVAIRAISDTAEEDLPLDMNSVLSDQGKVSIARVIGQVAMNPQAVPGLVRLGRNSKRAAESLAKFLDQYVTVLARQMNPLDVRTAAAGDS